MNEELKDWWRSIISSLWQPWNPGVSKEKFLKGEIGHWYNFEDMLREIKATFGWRPELKEIKKFIEKIFSSLPAAPVILRSPEIIPNHNMPSPPNMIAWGAYKTMLLEEAGFSNESVMETEQSAAWVVSHLNLGDRTEDGASRRGLVMGSVQSGKTANMGAVMSMAADCGINVIIVFSGMYNSLREQTAGRFGEELQSTASVQWEILDLNANPNALSQIDLKPNSPKRYVIVVLKNPARMTRLLRSIEDLHNQKKQMKVLILDDEADQAGINTLNVNSGRRTSVNGKLVALTFNLLRGRRQPSPVPFGAMNYLAYTATPYANILNESGEQSLYPASFAISLAEPKQYFGARVIFGDPDISNSGMDIIRDIPQEEADYISKLDGKSNVAKFKDAVRWFFCVSAALRSIGHKSPITMLVNTNVKTVIHETVDAFLSAWLNSESDSEFLRLCEEIYEMETSSFTKEDLWNAFPGGYELIDSVPDTFPIFAEIKSEILELKKGLCRIEVDADGKYRYGRGVHLCVDNGATNDNYRIRYPDKNALAELEKAPVFIVVGGLTLSRGLTLKGLVCSYFARKIQTADTLMQAARWFGYRKGYELYQRIWMTEETLEKFRAMTRMDIALKRELTSFKNQDKSPMEFGPRIQTFPENVHLKLAAKNRTQAMISADVDYTGASFETTEFTDSLDVQKKNVASTRDFLTSLGTPEVSITRNGVVWRHIESNKVLDFLYTFKLPDGSLFEQSRSEMHSWVKEENKNGRLNEWNVAIIDGDRDNFGTFRINERLSVHNLPRSQEIHAREGCINIGSLRSGDDVMVDVIPEKLSETDRLSYESAMRTRKNFVGVRSSILPETPLLFIYSICGDGRFKPTSCARKAITIGTEIIGLVVVIPGNRGDESHVRTVTVRL